MSLTREFRESASGRAKCAVFVLALAVLPLAATDVSVGEDNGQAVQVDRGEKEKPKKSQKNKKARQMTATNVVAHWRFQKGMNGRAADRSHLIEDSSGNDHHALAIGGPEYQSVNLPASNLALRFDGRDDRLFIADDNDFHLTESMTIEAIFGSTNIRAARPG